MEITRPYSPLRRTKSTACETFVPTQPGRSRVALPRREAVPVDYSEALTPVPLEYLKLPAELDGSSGTNRDLSRANSLWQHDAEAVQAWLNQYQDTPSTYASYRKEAERVVLWAVIAKQKALSSLTEKDLVSYQQFLLAPEPASLWMTQGGRYSRQSNRWRPFARPLSQHSAHQAITVVHALFEWLVEHQYLKSNQVLRGKHPDSSTKRIAPMADSHICTQILQAIQAMPRETPTQILAAEQAQWIVQLRLFASVSVDDMASMNTGEFLSGLETSKTGRRENKREMAAIRKGLKKYRLANGLSPDLQTIDSTPLVLALMSKNQPETPGRILRVLKRLITVAVLN